MSDNSQGLILQPLVDGVIHCRINALSVPALEGAFQLLQLILSSYGLKNSSAELFVI